MRITLNVILIIMLLSLPSMAIEQKWIDDLNRRFPGIGDEFQQAVQQKLDQDGGTLGVEELVGKLIASPNYTPGKITNALSFSVHSELMLLYPVLGEYQKSLEEAKLLRDFVLKYSLEDEGVIQTFRGVYAELLIINGQYEEALREIESTITMNPDEEGNYLSRGIAYVKLEQLDEAFENLKILIQKPEAVKYTQQLFVFIMENREVFQEPQVQRNTMIDVMLRELEPEVRPRTRILDDPDRENVQDQTSAESSQQKSATVEENRMTEESLAEIMSLDLNSLGQLLGPPVMEYDGEHTLDREYAYQGRTLTIRVDKVSQKILSAQIFFLPPVDEATALAQIGAQQLDIVPTMHSDMLKVWSPYGEFSKLRLSLSEGQVIAVVVEP